MSQAGSRDDDEAISMIVASLRRVPNESVSTCVKSCNYLNHVLMRMEANEAGADEALELDLEGYVCEAPGYNVFIVKDGVLRTPGDNILRGITRQTVLDFAERNGWPVAVGRVQPFDVYTADEAFLTSTAGGIVPVGRLDGRVIGSGGRGPITEKLQHAYLELLESGHESTPLPRHASA
jgi:branched-chain amino acid aminotransferase